MINERSISKGMSLSETITIKQSSQVATIGGSLDVTCEVSGVSSRGFTIKWSKVGQADLDDNVTSRGGTMRLVY